MSIMSIGKWEIQCLFLSIFKSSTVPIGNGTTFIKILFSYPLFPIRKMVRKCRYGSTGWDAAEARLEEMLEI